MTPIERAKRILLAAFALSLLCRLGYSQFPPSEKYDLEFAEKSLLTELYIQQVNPSLCSEKPIACLGGDRAELALAVIAGHNSSKSLRMLARLHRLGLDGALAESFDQYVCEKGHVIEKYLVALKPAELRSDCENEFRQIGEQLKGEIVGTPDLDHYCATTGRIKQNLRQSLEMVQHLPKSCEP